MPDHPEQWDEALEWTAGVRSRTNWEQVIRLTIGGVVFLVAMAAAGLATTMISYALLERVFFPELIGRGPEASLMSPSWVLIFPVGIFGLVTGLVAGGLAALAADRWCVRRVFQRFNP